MGAAHHEQSVLQDRTMFECHREAGMLPVQMMSKPTLAPRDFYLSHILHSTLAMFERIAARHERRSSLGCFRRRGRGNGYQASQEIRPAK